VGAEEGRKQRESGAGLRKVKAQPLASSLTVPTVSKIVQLYQAVGQ
jgi:hypothetical protein